MLGFAKKVCARWTKKGDTKRICSGAGAGTSCCHAKDAQVQESNTAFRAGEGGTCHVPFWTCDLWVTWLANFAISLSPLRYSPNLFRLLRSVNFISFYMFYSTVSSYIAFSLVSPMSRFTLFCFVSILICFRVSDSYTVVYNLRLFLHVSDYSSNFTIYHCLTYYSI